MKKEKKFLILTLVITIFILSVISYSNYKIDPFYYYRGVVQGEKVVFFGEMYQNLGMARNFDYDTLITGTSMTENFTKSAFDKKFNTKSIKLPFAGGHMKDFTQLFENAFSTHKLKYVFFGLDIYSLMVHPNSTRFPYKNYQISKNPIFDLQYLLDGNNWANYSFEKRCLQFNTAYTYNEDLQYKWADYSVFGKKIVLQQYQRPEEKTDEYFSKEELKNAKMNLESLITYIRLNKDTEFYIFYAPYSILYWDYVLRNKSFDFQIQILKNTTQELLKMSNVKLYGFLFNENIISNLDNYKDYTHYSEEVNDWMLGEFDRDHFLLTKENFQKAFDKFSDYIKNYDFNNIFLERYE